MSLRQVCGLYHILDVRRDTSVIGLAGTRESTHLCGPLYSHRLHGFYSISSGYDRVRGNRHAGVRVNLNLQRFKISEIRSVAIPDNDPEL